MSHLSFTSLRSFGLKKAAGFGALALTLCGSAQAALYTGTWDPNYGVAFPNLGWQAKALLDIPDDCLAQGSGNYGTTPAGDCTGSTVLSASVSFYNVANASAILETFTLNPTVFVNSVDIADNKLVGISTGFFDNFIPTGASASIAGSGAYSFSLALTGATAQLAYVKPTGASPLCTIPGFIPGTTCGFSDTPARGVFALAVPEPGTYALMLAGLGAVGFMARRRRV